MDNIKITTLVPGGSGSIPGSGLLSVTNGAGFRQNRKRSNVSFHSDITIENDQKNRQKYSKYKLQGH